VTAFQNPPVVGGGAATITLIEGSSFCISDANANMDARAVQGLFVQDTRVISRWRLRINGADVLPVTVHRSDPFAASFIGRVAPADGRSDSAVLVIRRRYVGNGMREDITVRSTGADSARCRVELAVSADLADLFEVKDQRAGVLDAHTDVSVRGQELRITRVRAGRPFGVLVRMHDVGAVLTADGAIWQIALSPRQTTTMTVEVLPIIAGKTIPLLHSRGEDAAEAAPARKARAWQRASPQIHTADRAFGAVLGRSLEDLGSLRIFDASHPERAVVAAGAPWFMALFGRDALLTSWMLLPVDSSVALGTLQTLAERQGSEFQAASEEEPGRILHETRLGPVAELALGGASTYYGTADATALFVMLLGELNRWGRHRDEVDALFPHAARALRWIEEHGDQDGDGFVEYERKTDRGLVNQGWKDSWDGINFADGRLARTPIALAEVQAYAYAAFRAGAALAAQVGEQAAAQRWAGRARRLRRRFNETFWLGDRGWYAVALDHEKRPVDALTSNIGHCLWTGIADRDKAARIADLLLSPPLFTGWGIRTLSSSMGAYNPMSYHNGSVWPHDTAICVAGLTRYGFVDHAQRVTAGLLDAAEHFEHRLPELFCGFAREEFTDPIPYPTSCSPQAWASAAPLLLLRSMLRFDPDVGAGRLWCAPAVRDRFVPLRVGGIRVGSQNATIEVRADSWEIGGLDRSSGIELIRAARPAVVDG
jgi:glycogen debranching enzyme